MQYICNRYEAEYFSRFADDKNCVRFLREPLRHSIKMKIACSKSPWQVLEIVSKLRPCLTILSIGTQYWNYLLVAFNKLQLYQFPIIQELPVRKSLKTAIPPSRNHINWRWWQSQNDALDIWQPDSGYQLKAPKKILYENLTHKCFEFKLAWEVNQLPMQTFNFKQ